MSKNRKRTSQPKKKIDIVITTAGRFDLLKLCLESVAAQTMLDRCNVIVIDNASDAEERIRYSDIFMNPVIDMQKRLTQEVGFPALANEGARMGKSELILFLSDDVTIKEDAIERMLARMENEKMGVLGVKLIFPENSTSQYRPAGKVQHVGLGMNIRGDIIHPLIAWNPKHPKTCISREVFAVTGACFLIRREIFKKAAGFFEGYGLGTYEDVDMCLQARSQGYIVFVDTDIIGYHYVGATAEKKQTPFPLGQNAMMFKARWQSTGAFIWDDYKFF